jgi:hypothetical protein
VPAHDRAVTKLLLILGLCGALANSLVSERSEPPLLIDSQPAPAPLDANS